MPSTSASVNRARTPPSLGCCEKPVRRFESARLGLGTSCCALNKCLFCCNKHSDGCATNMRRGGHRRLVSLGLPSLGAMWWPGRGREPAPVPGATCPLPTGHSRVMGCPSKQRWPGGGPEADTHSDELPWLVPLLMVVGCQVSFQKGMYTGGGGT